MKHKSRMMKSRERVDFDKDLHMSFSDVPTFPSTKVSPNDQNP